MHDVKDNICLISFFVTLLEKKIQKVALPETFIQAKQKSFVTYHSIIEVTGKWYYFKVMMWIREVFEVKNRTLPVAAVGFSK